MAMIICLECGRQISEYALTCPGCGIPMEMIRKLLAKAEPSPEPESETAENSIESASEQESIDVMISDLPVGKREISCVVCGGRFDIAEQHCPICKYPAFFLSPGSAMKTLFQLRTNNNDKAGIFDQKQPLLTRVYTYDEYLQLRKENSHERSDDLAELYIQFAEKGSLIAKANL